MNVFVIGFILVLLIKLILLNKNLYGPLKKIIGISFYRIQLNVLIVMK